MANLYVLLSDISSPFNHKLIEMMRKLNVEFGVVGTPVANPGAKVVAITFADLGEVWTLGTTSSKEGIDLPAWTEGLPTLVMNGSWMGQRAGLSRAFRAALVAEGQTFPTKPVSNDWRRDHSRGRLDGHGLWAEI